MWLFQTHVLLDKVEKIWKSEKDPTFQLFLFLVYYWRMKNPISFKIKFKKNNNNSIPSLFSGITKKLLSHQPLPNYLKSIGVCFVLRKSPLEDWSVSISIHKCTFALKVKDYLFTFSLFGWHSIGRGEAKEKLLRRFFYVNWESVIINLESVLIFFNI